MVKKYKMTKRIHPAYTEVVNAKKLKSDFPLEKILFGKYQYLYSSLDDKKRISLIKLPKYLYPEAQWEILCLKGKLFGDVERFATKKEAEKRICQLLS